MPRVGGPLENDEELGQSRAAADNVMRAAARESAAERTAENGAATALALLYVGDCIRVAVDALIARDVPKAPWPECNEIVTREGFAVGQCSLPKGHKGGCKCAHHLYAGE